MTTARDLPGMKLPTYMLQLIDETLSPEELDAIAAGPTPIDGILELLSLERERVAAVLRIHRPHTPGHDPIGITTPHGERCAHCFTPWPCFTARAAGAEA